MLYNHHNYVTNYTPGSGTTLATCTLDNGLVLQRDENDDGYYRGYLEAVPIHENPYLVPPVVGPNQVSEGFDYGMLTFYKGQVATEDDLPLVGNKKGDFYIDGNNIYNLGGKKQFEIITDSVLGETDFTQHPHFIPGQ